MCKQLTWVIPSLFVLMLGTARADLVSHWMLDEGAGTTVYDTSGGNNGTFVGKPVWTTGVTGGALNFDGESYVDCGNDASVNVTGPFSATIWIKPGTIGNIETAPLSKADSSLGWSWQLRYGWNTSKPTIMGWQFNSPAGSVWVFVEKDLPVGEWHHIAASHDGATVKCYLNGEETASAAMSGIVGGSCHFLIGSDGWRSDWVGDIDDVRLFNHGITEQEILAAMATEPIVTAYGPTPKDGVMIATTQATLKWSAGEHASLHEVYFGESLEAVKAATPADANLFVGRQPLTVLAVGDTGGVYPQGLEHGKTYYWRVDEVNDTHPDSPWTGSVWSFRVQPLTAWSPYPPDGMKYVDPEQDLSWEAGASALFYYVHIGEDFDAVNNAVSAAGWPTVEPSHDPGSLKLDTTYYWRVDAFAGVATYQGEVWTFTTRGTGGGVQAEYFNGMDLAGNPVLTQTEGSIDHTWGNLEVAGGLTDLVSARWTADLEAPFTETYRLITASDDGVRLWLDGRLIIDNWTAHSAAENAVNVDLVAGQIYLIKMEWYENTGSAVAQLSWESPTLPKQIVPQGWLQLPLWATSPSPVHGAPYTTQSPTLKWTAGDEATHHDIYFGEDAQAVANADTTTAGVYVGRQTADQTSYEPGDLEWGKTYYWRVDEVDTTNDKLWKGAVWAFTTADFLIVDDFESYTDDMDAGEAVWQTWIDGQTNLTGSTVGYWESPFAETEIVHSGYQSMPLAYDNTKTPYYSEADRTWTSAQDWTANGVNTLVLYVRGKPGNGNEKLYVTLEDRNSKSATVVSTNTNAVLATKWSEWSIPLTDFAGVNPAKIAKITIGLGDRSGPKAGGSGLVFVDDLRVIQR